MFTLAWTALMFFLSLTIWRTGRQHSQPELGFSSRDNYRENFFANFVRRMSMTAIILCAASSLSLWFFHSWFLAIGCVLAIPAVAAFQIFNSKRALEASSNRSLPRF